MQAKLDELIKDERKFLHDISSPLTVALGTTNILSDKLKAGQDVPKETLVDRIERVFAALEKMSKMVNARRDNIKSQQSPEA